jgi:hypothetical protein
MTSPRILDQRCYTSQFGRFLSADRFSSSAGPGVPLSWNKYLYVLGDPIANTDTRGTSVDCTDDDCDESDGGYEGYDSGDGGGGEGAGTTVCDSNGTNCHDSVTVNGDDDGGWGDDNGPQMGGVNTPLSGQPPNSFYIDPQRPGPVMRLFNQVGRWLLDIHWQEGHPDNPHIHVPTQPGGVRPSLPRTPISIPQRPVVPPGTTPGAPYSPWPRQPQPVVPIPPPSATNPLPIIIFHPCTLGVRVASCRTPVGAT